MPTNTFLSHIPARHYLREWREARGMSQEQLGKLCGASGATISRYEKGDRGLPLELQLKLFEHLDILPGQFFAPPETPSIDALVVMMSEKDRRWLLSTVEIASGLTPAERTELLAGLLKATYAFAKQRHEDELKDLSPQSPQSTPDEKV